MLSLLNGALKSPHSEPIQFLFITIVARDELSESASELLHVTKKLSLEPGDLCLGLNSVSVWLYDLKNVTLGL